MTARWHTVAIQSKHKLVALAHNRINAPPSHVRMPLWALLCASMWRWVDGSRHRHHSVEILIRRMTLDELDFLFLRRCMHATIDRNDGWAEASLRCGLSPISLSSLPLEENYNCTGILKFKGSSTSARKLLNNKTNSVGFPCSSPIQFCSRLLWFGFPYIGKILVIVERPGRQWYVCLTALLPRIRPHCSWHALCAGKKRVGNGVENFYGYVPYVSAVMCCVHLHVTLNLPRVL